MPKRRVRQRKDLAEPEHHMEMEVTKKKGFSLEFLNPFQRSCWETIARNHVVFLIGTAGTGKSFLATAFAIHSALENKTQKIIITRPIVEAGERLGFLPGSFEEKVHPFMLPLYDALDDLVGKENAQRKYIDKGVEVAPIAYLRGRTLKNAVCILDEAQNCSYAQLKLFITRIGVGSKMIITGDPKQSDLVGRVAMMDIIDKIGKVPGVAVIHISDENIVRHPIIADIAARI
jgi:phosphate starvation-inducible PhoH-like protein